MSGSLSDHRPTMPEAIEVYRLVEKWLGDHLDIMAVGSFGRNYRSNFTDDCTRVGDVDLVVTGNVADLEDVRERMGMVFGYFKNGNPKNLGLIGRVQVDLFFSEQKTAGATELFYLLPHTLQFALRLIAQTRGMSFGPKGLYRDDELIPTPYPHDVYKALGVEPFNYVELTNPALKVVKHKADKGIIDADNAG